MAKTHEEIHDKIHDLRSALTFLRDVPGQLLETDTEVDCNAEVSGVYRHVAPAAPSSAPPGRDRRWSSTM